MIPLLGLATLSAGIFFMIISTVGVIKLPDFCSRVHAAGIADSVGVALVLLGLAMQCELSVFTIKVLVLILLSWITSTTACNAVVYAFDFIANADNRNGD
ncbi:monovalent cation/H(+) antiporter subunit G [Anaplasma capra]|uniref:monovalent cation/H(+) antiporter subunit G n=1 Tax=Anaplasma capra TaxID=1562740 RepID=UPI0021D604AE|nr:monovalent cation/H(+) antiporter subunit G [Anaplasma capra]MCU7611518.1 monovalent cation/H(+) antiporter subunit G [Anaplasma capra]MCU7612043.1 monovalent cation/H(+) antiporter subunit G [Anaplasma capra]